MTLRSGAYMLAVILFTLIPLAARCDEAMDTVNACGSALAHLQTNANPDAAFKQSSYDWIRTHCEFSSELVEQAAVAAFGNGSRVEDTTVDMFNAAARGEVNGRHEVPAESSTDSSGLMAAFGVAMQLATGGIAAKAASQGNVAAAIQAQQIQSLYSQAGATDGAIPDPMAALSSSLAAGFQAGQAQRQKAEADRLIAEAQANARLQAAYQQQQVIAANNAAIQAAARASAQTSAQQGGAVATNYGTSSTRQQPTPQPTGNPPSSPTSTRQPPPSTTDRGPPSFTHDYHLQCVNQDNPQSCTFDVIVANDSPRTITCTAEVQLDRPNAVTGTMEQFNARDAGSVPARASSTVSSNWGTGGKYTVECGY